MRESGTRGLTVLKARSKCPAWTSWALMSSCSASRAASLHTADICDRKQAQIFSCQEPSVHPMLR